MYIGENRTVSARCTVADLSAVPHEFKDTLSRRRPTKLSARNILKGTIVEVTKGQTTAHVRIDVGGTIITSSITNEAVDDLGLKKGMSAAAVIKSSDVMVATD